MSGIQRWLPIFVEGKGYYLLPAAAAGLVIARYAASRAGLKHANRVLLPLLALLAAFSVPVWFNFFNYHFGGFVNPHEFFHYYLGSKYAREVGYFEMYNAALVADEETGLMFRPADGVIWNLETYDYVSASTVLADRDRIKSLFTPERWREWLKDVSYFKKRLRGPQWSEALRDMGYNGTPVWTMLAGGGLAGRIDTDDAAGMTLLALLDVVLLGAAAVCVAWAFGAWASLLMIVFLSSSYLMAHVHMKGAFLRTDFVVALVAAMCLLKKGRPSLAGALIGYASLVRIFPVLFLFGPGVKLATELPPVVREAFVRLGSRGALAVAIAAHAAGAVILVGLGWLAMGAKPRELLSATLGAVPVVAGAIAAGTVILLATTLTIWGTRKAHLDPRHQRFFTGFAVTAVALVLASVLYARGTADWEEFGRKMALHRATYNFWNVGLTSVVIARFDAPGSRAEQLAARPAALRSWQGNVWFLPESVHDRAWAIRLLQLLGIAGAWLAVRRLDDAPAFALGFVPTFVLTAPTYYYYIILLLPYLYFAAHPDRLRSTLGLLYLFLFGALGFTFYFLWDQYFTTYYWNSVMAAGVAIAMTAAAFGTFTPWSAGAAPSTVAAPRRRSR